jgi:hypothetical protein
MMVRMRTSPEKNNCFVKSLGGQSYFLSMFSGRGYPSSHQGKQLGFRFESRSDFRRCRQPERSARHLPTRTGRMDFRVSPQERPQCKAKGVQHYRTLVVPRKILVNCDNYRKLVETFHNVSECKADVYFD